LSAAAIAQALLGDGAYALRLGRRDRVDAHPEPALT